MISGSNTFTGHTTISKGTLKLGSAGDGSNSPLGQVASSHTAVTPGAVLDLNGFTLSTAELLWLYGTGISNGGALINSSNDPVIYSGEINLRDASNIIGTTGNITVSGYNFTRVWRQASDKSRSR